MFGRTRNGRKKMYYRQRRRPRDWDEWFGPPVGGHSSSLSNYIEDLIALEEFNEHHKKKEADKQPKKKDNQPSVWTVFLLMTLLSPIIGPAVQKLMEVGPTVIK